MKSGDVIDYRVIELVGSGGNGSCVQNQHVITKRIEAMKFLPPGWARTKEVQRFQQEISTSPPHSSQYRGPLQCGARQ
jgi:hypothetical protein